MANHTIAPFYQLGRFISCEILHGNCSTELTGEVMDTDEGWIAIKDESSGEIRWYNLDHIVHIMVMNHKEHD